MLKLESGFISGFYPRKNQSLLNSVASVTFRDIKHIKFTQFDKKEILIKSVSSFKMKRDKRTNWMKRV